MSLATLNWRRTAGVIPASNSIKDVLDAIYTAGTATTYWDGSARTAGSGSAWTFSRYQNAGTTEAVYASPVTGALNHRLIMGGASGAKTPTMASPDTWAVSVVLAGLAKNAGAFNAWDNAAPFTSGQFYGYWRALNLGTHTVAKVHLVESQEAIVVVFETTTGACQSIICGAYLDPETSTSTAAESDGRRYGLAVPGNSVTTSTFMETNASWLSHNATANALHHMIANIGAVSTFINVQKMQLFQSGTGGAVTSTAFANAAGEVVIMPVAFGCSSAAPNDVFVGVTRQFGMERNVLSMTTRQYPAGTDVYHNVGYSTSSAGNALGFKV